MTLSLCMIVKDEARRLPHCLKSVQGYVDEMIVLDTGSQDETMAIAQQLGAQVDTIPWTHDFAAARNQSIARATGTWILVLDADETLTPAGQTLLTSLRTEKAADMQPLDTILSINLLRHEVDAAQSPYSSVSRLFRNHTKIQFQRPYHESIDDSVMAILATEPHWQILDWPAIAIDHGGYQAEAITQQNKFHRAEQAMVAYLAQHPEDAYISSKLGALYTEQGQWEQGQALLQQGLAAAPTDPYTTYELYYHLGIAARAIGQLQQAANAYEAALLQPIPDILKVGARINLGSLRQLQQDFAGAAKQFELATQAAPQFPTAYFNWGTALRSLGALEQAVAAYQQAIALNPNYAEAYQNLGVALFKLGRLPQSRQAFQQAISLYQTINPAAGQRLRAGLRSLGL